MRNTQNLDADLTEIVKTTELSQASDNCKSLNAIFVINNLNASITIVSFDFLIK